MRRRSATTGSSLVVNQNTTAMMARPAAQISATPFQPSAIITKGAQEFGHGRADIAGAENAERRALLAGLVPARNIGDADRERAAGDADAQRRDQELRIGVRRK